MNNDNDLNLHSMTKLWLRYWSDVDFKLTKCSDFFKSFKNFIFYVDNHKIKLMERRFKPFSELTFTEYLSKSNNF